MKYLLSQLVWNEDPFGGRWVPPVAGDQFLDLRPLSAQASKTVSGHVLVATERDPLPGEFLVAGGLQDSVASTRDGVKDRLGIPEALTVGTLPELVQRLLSVYSDPDAGMICPPVMPDRRGQIRLNLGELAYIYPVPKSGVEFDNIIKQVHAEYRAVKAAGGDTHRKLLSVYRTKFGIDNHEVFIPADLPKETPVKPTTTIRDNFNVGDHADINGQNSSDGDWAWEAIEQSGSSVIKTNTSTAAEFSLDFGTVVVYRANKDLSATDYYVQAIIAGNGDEIFPGLIARKDSSATNTYYLLLLNVISDLYQIYKRVSGTYTELWQVSTSIIPSTNYTVKFNLNGSTLQGFKDGVQVGTDLTDSAISTGLRTGLYASATGAGGTKTGVAEDFEASDGIGGGGGAVEHYRRLMGA